MKARPILFSAPMVRALLAGTKTQTRRVIPLRIMETLVNPASVTFPIDAESCCAYGQPGDRIWGRETFWAWGRWETRFSEKKGRDEWHFIDMTRECGKSYLYDADKPDPQPRAGKRDGGAAPKWHKRPAIFIPRDASRILLEITSVRVERLRDISEKDAIAEGCFALPGLRYPPEISDKANLWTGKTWTSAVAWYRDLWESLNGPGSWDANPWVWVLDFKRVEGGAQ